MSEAGPSTATSSTTPSSTAVEPRPLGKGTSGRVSGKWWKEEKKPIKRTHLPPVLKSKSWEKQKEAMNREKAIRQLIREQREEREQAEKARKQAIVDRRKAKEEKERLERMREKMSAKKLERLKKKLGRTKKINQ